MKYTVTFSVTETYPTVEVEAKDRHEAIKLCHDMWNEGKIAPEGIVKDAQWHIVSHKSVNKPKGS